MTLNGFQFHQSIVCGMKKLAAKCNIGPTSPEPFKTNSWSVSIGKRWQRDNIFQQLCQSKFARHWKLFKGRWNHGAYLSHVEWTSPLQVRFIVEMQPHPGSPYWETLTLPSPASLMGVIKSRCYVMDCLLFSGNAINEYSLARSRMLYWSS
jgi:hypothetical protein